MHTKQNRKCVACRNVKQQHEMIRVARVNKEYLLDTEFVLGGRGAYVCRDKDCINLAVKKKLFNKAFKCNLEANIYEEMGKYEQNN